MSGTSSDGETAKGESDWTTWSRPSTTSTSMPERSPATPWCGPAITSIAGASGDDAVSQDLAKGMHRPPRIMDFVAVDQLVAWATSDEKAQEKLRLELNGVAADLAGPNPTPIERVLAEVAATNWFFLRQCEACYIGAVDSEDGITLAQSDHGQRRIDRAHRRLMTSLKTLATARRLAVPAIQLNVARQQVNVAGSACAAPETRQLPA
jgi:hypothetical protein